jgi:hypothetical protein
MRLPLLVPTLVGVWLLISSRGRIRDREQRTTTLTGLLLLFWTGLTLFGSSYFSIPRSVWAIRTFYFAKHVVTGVCVVMTIFWARPDGAKPMLTISSVALVGFNIYAFMHYDLRHLAPAIRLFYMGNGLTIGMSITSATLLWLEGTKKPEPNASRESGVPESTARTGEPGQSSGTTGPYAVAPRRIMNSPPISASTREYRMKVSQSGLYLLSAVLFIVASIPIAARGLASTSIPMALGRAAIGALLLFSGVFMVATVVRSRLLIEESQIRYRIIFREEVFPLSEIEGFRTTTTGPPSHRVSRRVICVKGRRKPIETVLYDPDEFLQAWLDQFPNLDRSDQVCN